MAMDSSHRAELEEMILDLEDENRFGRRNLCLMTDIWRYMYPQTQGLSDETFELLYYT